MSDQSLGPGWWYASDGKWYPPETHPDYKPPPPPRGAPSYGSASTSRPVVRRLGPLVFLALASIGLVAGVSIYLEVTQDGTEDTIFGDDTEGDTEDDGIVDEDEDLGALRDACGDGDLAACDRLYFESPVGSDDEDFGSTCGGREAPQEGDCA